MATIQITEKTNNPVEINKIAKAGIMFNADAVRQFEITKLRFEDKQVKLAIKSVCRFSPTEHIHEYEMLLSNEYTILDSENLLEFNLRSNTFLTLLAKILTSELRTMVISLEDYLENEGIYTKFPAISLPSQSEASVVIERFLQLN